MITKNDLLKVFEYKDGHLYRKPHNKYVSPANLHKPAGYLHPTGYRLIRVNGQQLKEHRLIFLFHHGYMPQYIDHKNGIKNDNRIENLRAATKAQNCQNSFKKAASASGIKGVSKMPRLEIWRVRLQANCKKYEIHSFKTKKLAFEFLELLREMAHGEFANNGLKGA